MIYEPGALLKEINQSNGKAAVETELYHWQ